MKLLRHTLLLLLLPLLFGPVAKAQQLRFTPNQGQWDDPSLYRCQMEGATVWLEHDRLTFLLEHPDNIHLKHRHADGHHHSDRYRSHAYQMRFLGSQAEALVAGDTLPGRDNFFLGNERHRWQGDVRSSASVSYRELYAGIDMVVYSGALGLKYDLVLAPGANPSQIRIRYDGTDGLSLRGGNLVVKTSVGDVVEQRPFAYQTSPEGDTIPVRVAYTLQHNEVGLRTMEPYDTTQKLVLDPQLIFSTYTGSTADNWGTTAAYDQDKNVYTAGLVFNQGYPTSLGAYDRSWNGNADVGIFVFSPDGTQRLSATYLGGVNADMPHSMYVNELNELVIFGTTGSPNFPVTPGAYDTTFNGGSPINYEGPTIAFPQGSDIFVCRFNHTLSQLCASTFVGGSGNDGLNYEEYYNNSLNTSMLGNDSIYANYGDGARGELITDNLANIYVGSTTHSTDFPVTPNAFRTTHSGGQDGIVFKLDYNLQYMLWAGYLGGSADDAVYSIDVDDQYNLLVCGGTCSRDFPATTGAARPLYRGGNADGFVAKINYFGNELMASSFFGHTHYDQCYFVRTGKQNDVFLFGQTRAQGTQMVVNASYCDTNSGQFLARLTPDLDSVKWCTVFGSGRGEPDISPTAFAADICDRVYAVGWGRYFCGYPLTGNPQFFGPVGTEGMPVTPDAYQSNTDSQDFYIFSMDNDATHQIYGSFFGEYHTSGSNGHDHVDGGTSRFDRCATLYQSVCASCGGYSNFPATPGAWSSSNNANNCNNAVFTFNVSSDFPVADFPSINAQCVNLAEPILFPFTGRADSVWWDYGDGTSGPGSNDTSHFSGSHLYHHPGLYTVTLVAYMDTGCHSTDTMTRQVMILGDTSYYLDTLRTCGNAPVQLGIAPVLSSHYRWIQGLVTDSTISNPYTSTPGHYILVVSRGSEAQGNYCADTIHQIVEYGQSDFEIFGDTISCSSPMTFSTDATGERMRYLWSLHPDLSEPLGNSPEITLEVDSSITLYCHIVDRLGCEGTKTIHVDFYRIMDTLLVDDPPCPGTCDGSVTVVNTGIALPPFSYQYDGNPSNDSILSSLCPGQHTVLFADAAGCTVSKEFIIHDTPAPIIRARIDNIRCIHDHSGAIVVTINGVHTPYSIQWDDGDTNFARYHLEPGSYHAVVTDSNGCQFDTTFLVLDAPDSFADINVWADDTLLFINESTHLHADGCPTCTYLWNPANPLNDATLQNPLATLQDTTTFVCTLADSAGCLYQDSVMVYCIRLDCGTTALFIPNAFTPNGDGLNDQLCFRNEWVTSFLIRIFSRWGEMVYESDDINACWDGNFHGQPALPGVYTFYCHINCEGQQEATFKGDITLIR